MKKHSKIFKTFLIFTSFFFMMFLSCDIVRAQFYQESENSVVGYSIDKDNNTISVSIKYQNGVSDVAVYICNPDECKSGTYNKYQRIYSDQLTAYKKSAGDIESINSTESTVTEVFKFDNGSMVSGTKSLNAYSDKITSDGKVNNEYKIIVYAKYCVVRNKDKTDCSKYDSDDSQLRLNETFILKGGLTNYGDLNTTIGNILTIINNIVIPVLWVALGVLLISRGIILSIAIIKSSDEPEVRKKKITGLIWLGIGIGIAYIVTISASAVMSLLGYGGYF